MVSSVFSITRFIAVLKKEFVQMRRDRLTFAMMIGVPLLQLILFGYAINTNPRNLPMAVVVGDNSALTRSYITGLQNTKYFKIVARPKSFAAAQKLLAENKVLFITYIPPDFTERLVRGERPELLIEADGTEPVAIGNALTAVPVMTENIFNPWLQGNWEKFRAKPKAYQLITHIKYNPENITQYNIVPGLLGVVLTMTMVLITSLALTRERERGTMESLLATPVKPLEVMLGKIVPYIMVGYVQVFVILTLAVFLFKVPIYGSVLTLLLAVLPFIAANLAVGLTFSSIARNQLQAIQMAFFFFLPSILLSGFMFPFKGMPEWAQWLGTMLPLTHFNIVVRGIMLKGNDWLMIAPQMWAIWLFMIVVLFIGVRMYRQTLD